MSEEDIKDMETSLEEVNKNYALLKQMDDFEEEIRLIETLNKKYNDLKNEIKKAMVQIGREGNLEQLKWTTPKGTKITCSIGHPAEIEKQTQKEFDVELLKKEYPDVYEKCLVEKQRSVIVKNATSDTLRITLGKE